MGSETVLFVGIINVCAKMCGFLLSFDIMPCNVHYLFAVLHCALMFKERLYDKILCTL